jgi:hypothetical protein
MGPLPWEHAMKKLLLMTLFTATALSPVSAFAADIVPTSAHIPSAFDDAAGFQREDRRADRQAARAERTPEQREERRAERQQNRPERAQRAQTAQAQMQAPAPQPEADRQQRQPGVVRTERRDASQDGRYYDRNRDGNLDRRWDQNRDGNLDRNWDRDRDGRLDRRLDRNDDERIDRRYDQNRNGQLDRRVDRNNDNRLDRSRGNDRWTNNWRNHRQSNSSYYRPGRYYSPYSGHSYSRISIGFSLGSGYYGSRYWINDPWEYRLPAAYGTYRWVRYYDDVLLVDIRNGRVVDVIRDFFW